MIVEFPVEQVEYPPHACSISGGEDRLTIKGPCVYSRNDLRYDKKGVLSMLLPVYSVLPAGLDVGKGT